MYVHTYRTVWNENNEMKRLLFRYQNNDLRYYDFVLILFQL